MTLIIFIALALAGGVGAASRFLLDDLVRRRTRGSLPWATILINLTGSFILGLVTGLVTGGLLPSGWLLIAGTGFLGGYTTFSTASFETVRLLQQGKALLSLINSVGVIVATTALAGAGLAIGFVAASQGA